MKQNKTKLSITTLMITAIVCFIVAILGFVGTPFNSVSAETTPQTYYLISSDGGKDDINKWTTAEAPAEGATKVTINFKTIARDLVGRHAQMLATDGTNEENSPFHGAYQFNDTWSPVGQMVVYTYDLVNKTGELYYGTTKVMSMTWTGELTKFGSLWYKARTGAGLSALFEITAVDDTGKDLGIVALTDGLTVTTDKVYTVTMNANNGTDAAKVFVKAGETVAKTTPTYDGHLFKGWFTDEQCTTAYDFSQAVNNDITLYAKWVSISHVVARTHVVDNQTVDKWITSISRLKPAEGATKVYFEHTVPVEGLNNNTDYAGAVVYSASGEEIAFRNANAHIASASHAFGYEGHYTFVFDLVEDTIVCYRGTTQVFSAKATAGTLANCVSFGYTVRLKSIGYTYTNIKVYDDTGKDLGLTTKNLTYSTIEFPQVTFNADNGTATNVVEVTGATVTKPADPIKEGYVFTGWYVDEQLTEAYDFNAEVTGDLTITAKWADFDTYYADLVSTGAPSIKLDTNNKSGIRFATTIDTALLAQLANEGYTYTLGTLIVPFDYVGDVAPTMEWLDANGKGYYNIVSTYDGTGNMYYGTLRSLKAENFGRKWVGLGYVAVDMGDDTVKYFYAEFDANNAKSIYDVAESFYNQYKDDDGETENIEIAKAYIDSVVVLDAEYQVVAKATGIEVPYQVAVSDSIVAITVKDDVDFVIKSVVIDGRIAKVVIADGGKTATYQIV